MPPAKESWIWTNLPHSRRNAYVRFRRTWATSGEGVTKLKISADSRYWLYFNGRYVGTGPVRSWPNHWKFDEYEITPLLNRGENVISVLVNHFGESTFQYLPANPGLWVQITAGDSPATPLLETDESWQCAVSPAHICGVPRIGVQEPFEEQFDARLQDDWHAPGFDTSEWAQAVAIQPPHPHLEPRGIPFLTQEPVFPQRVLRAEQIKPAAALWTLNVKPYFAPQDTTSNISFVKGYLFTKIWSETAQSADFIRAHHHEGEFKVNGKTVPALPSGMNTPVQPQKVELCAGWNTVVIPYPGLGNSTDVVKPEHAVHLPQFTLTVNAPLPIRWACRGATGGAPWAFVGPFEFTAAERDTIEAHMDFPRVVSPRAIHPTADAATEEAFYRDERASTDPDLFCAPYFQELHPEDIYHHDVASAAFSDEVAGPHAIENGDALLSDNAEWAVLRPGNAGRDVRVLIDFGREIIGNHFFEVEAEEGAILDIHNFEFIQADGLENDARGMNNSLRYICREGRQSFRALQRRGFQYTWLIARGLTRPLRIRSLGVEFSTYPQAHRGGFICNDSLLNRIWEVGAHTLRCCSEDTYTDCPSYEQTHWVGDARNEALVDWVINGDSRLWFRCLEQTAQSLEQSPLTLSQVPSGWANILPAWSFLWMRSCREYLLWTGDYAGAAKLLPWVIRNADGIESHINRNGLFEIKAWNLFDWADMDTPSNGVVTHNNCLATLALRESAELAEWLADPKTAQRFRKTAASLEKAINRHLWDEDQEAYVDSIHANGTVSRVFSQQTQTVALISSVATGKRAECCREMMHRPPKNFVKAGSPFFEFFLLEAVANEDRAKVFLDLIRKDWGFMIEQRATTFWEMWSLKSGRLTRSHCHGWSAAPTFFLSSVVLGVRPTQPGFAEVEFTPQLGNLKFARGTMPTPRGPIEIVCTQQGGKLNATLRLPPGIKLKKSKSAPTSRAFQLKM